MLRHRLALPALLLHRCHSTFRPAQTGFRALLFHDIADDRLDAFRTFARHARDRWGTIDPDGAAAWLTGDGAAPSQSGPTPCLFTFDDGFASNYRVAREILKPLGIRALFFVCPALVDLEGPEQRAAIAAQIFRAQCDAADLPPGQRLMTWDELRALKAAGHEIGSHGFTHKRLTELDEKTLETEIRSARDRLETEMGDEIPWYAFTFGDIGSISDRELRVIARMHRFCRSGVRGMNGRGTAPHAVRADAVDLDGPESYRALIAEGGLDGRYREARQKLDLMATGYNRASA